MIALVEGAERQKTPNEIALNILLAGMTIIFVFAVATIPSFASYAGRQISVLVLVALFVTLIPTTIGALLSAIGIAGMDRLVRFNVLAMSGRAVEAAGDVDTLLLDKTGTITLGNRQATEFIPLAGRQRDGARRCRAARLAFRRDAGRPLHRRAGQGELRHPRPRHGAAAARSSSRSRRRRASAASTLEGDRSARARSTPCVDYVRGQAYRATPTCRRRARARTRMAERNRQDRRHAAGRGAGRQAARRHPPEGHRQGRHPRALRRAAARWASAR